MQIAQLDDTLDRASFDCGSEALTRYFRERVTQDIRRRVAACCVALHEHRVAGYYTLAAASLALTDVPAALAKKLPRYPAVPAVRLGRLAVHAEYQGKGLGATLLFDALLRAARSEIAAYALVVDAKDAPAARLYLHYEFIAVPDSPLVLFLPLASIPRA